MMAEFCKQCAHELGFAPPYGHSYDFAGLTTEQDEAQGLYTLVLCEGCGPCQVNKDGACMGTCMNPRHDALPTPAGRE